MGLHWSIGGILGVPVLLLLAPVARCGEQDWEIETRTLAQAADGSPDSRTSVGIGEWVELKVVPETITNVEWLIKGNALVTNRFGNPTLLLVGWGKDEGEIQMSAEVHDQAVAGPPAGKPDPNKDFMRELEAGFATLRRLVGEDQKFDAACQHLEKTLRPRWSDFEATGAMDMKRLANFLTDSDVWSSKFPGSREWANFRRHSVETAGFRLAACLDCTADKTALPAEYWALLHASIANLQSLRKQFEDAGGEKGAEDAWGFKHADKTLPQVRKAHVANALRNHLSGIGELLRIQIRNSLPGLPAASLQARLRELGFSDQEIRVVYPEPSSQKRSAER